MENKPLLQVNNLKKVFTMNKDKPFVAVDNISFTLHEGEILGFLGPNGAGKTTTIQMLLGLMTPTSGTIDFFGKSLAIHRSEILNLVTFASAYTKLAGRLTLYENLDIFGQIYQIPKAERRRRIEQFLTFFGLWDIRDRRAGVLSAGQTTRLMLSKAFLPHPKVILLDEPTASLDPDVCIEIRKFILEQREKRNISVLFTSHNMAEVEEVCDRVLVLKNGSIIADNTPYDIARSMNQTKVHLFLKKTDNPKAHQLLSDNQYSFAFTKPFTIVEVEEEGVAALLQLLSKHSLHYSQISINEPTLEDYFVHVARQEGAE